MVKKSEVGWIGGGLFALLVILIKTSPKLIVALAVGLNMGDFLAGIFPGLHNDVQQQKQERMETAAQATPTQLETAAQATPTQFSIPAPQPDPALLMASRVFVFTTSSPLSAYMNDYKKIAGTLARLQVRSLRAEAVRYQLPVIMINGNNSCKKSPSIGVYHPACSSIGVDFSDGNSAYENDEEVIATLAHEWGHHLANITGLKTSWNEGEIMSDCFAGLVMGHLHTNSLATKQEVENAGVMMIQIGNNSATGTHPNSETRLSAFIGGAASVTAPGGEQARMYGVYCGSLDQILDKERLINSGLTWS
jgi:hypothetical protein